MTVLEAARLLGNERFGPSHLVTEEERGRPHEPRSPSECKAGHGMPVSSGKLFTCTWRAACTGAMR
jgi:hypothetical protein